MPLNTPGPSTDPPVTVEDFLYGIEVITTSRSNCSGSTNNNLLSLLQKIHTVSGITSLEGWNLATAIRWIEWVFHYLIANMDDRVGSSSPAINKTNRRTAVTKTTTIATAATTTPFHSTTYASYPNNGDNYTTTLLPTNATGPTNLIVVQLLEMVNQCWETWEDRIVYATLFHRPDRDKETIMNSSSNNVILRNIQDVLIHFSISDQWAKDGQSKDSANIIRAWSLTTLTTGWDMLERVHRLTTCLSSFTTTELDATWWWMISTNMPTSHHGDEIEHEDEANNTRTLDQQQAWKDTIRFVLQNVNTINADGIRPEQWKATCAGFLSHVLLQREALTDWVLTCIENSHEELCQGLLCEANRLLDRNMPPSLLTKLSLNSLRLWIVLNGALGTADATTTLSCVTELLDLVFCAAMGGLPNGTYRWILSSHYPVSHWAQAILYCLYRSARTNLQGIIRDHPLTHDRMRQAWMILMGDDDQQLGVGRLETAVNDLFILCNFSEKQFCQTLQTVLDNETHTSSSPKISACKLIPLNLLHLIRTRDSIPAASVLRRLLQDRYSGVRGHASLLATLWQAVDDHFVRQCIDMLMARPKTFLSTWDYHAPKMLCLWDTLQIILAVDSKLREVAIASLSMESADSLIQYLAPKQSTGLQSQTSAMSSLDSSASTPPANNLSRVELDRCDLSVSTDRRCRQRPGLDLAIEVSAATTLALLARAVLDPTLDKNYDWTRLVTVQQRLTRGIHNWLGEHFESSASQNSAPSLEITTRRLRLVTVLQSQQEEAIALALFGVELSHDQTTKRQRGLLRHYIDSLQQSKEREEQLVLEREELQQSVDRLSASRRQTTAQMKARFTSEVQEQIQLHSIELSKAISHSNEISSQLAIVEQKLMAAERELAQCQARENQARQQAEESISLVSDLRNQVQTLTTRLDESEIRFQTTANKLEAKSVAYESIVQRERTLREQMDANTCIVEAAEDSERELRDSLENIFADMVSLATMYEIKEKEAESIEKHSEAEREKLSQQLKTEQRRNAQLEEQLKQLRFENDELSNKCAKTREKLENERRERKSEIERRNKRVGPISYINQLHKTSVPERTLFLHRTAQTKVSAI